MTKKRQQSGASPGTLVYTGDQPLANPDVTIIWYSLDSYSEQFQRGTNCVLPQMSATTWYDVRCISDVAVIGEICKTFNIPTLAVENITDVQQRPKIDDYENGLFFSARALSFHEVEQRVLSEQVSFFLGENFVLSFQENKDDLFPVVRERLKNPRGRLRHRGSDYLAYALLDYIIDGYFPVLDQIEEKVQALESEILGSVDRVKRNHIYHLKRQVMEVRRVVMPLREVLNRFSVAESEFVNDENTIFFRDLQDHIRQVADNTENLRDMIQDLQEVYNIERDKKTSHVMKVLTVVSTIFIPLTFIVGVYGTNFDNVPELHYQYGYPTMWAVMILLSGGLLLIFKRKGWL
ncbi:MAG: hypothetical protein RL757_1124 [Bacteroidota bacterium]|jgi:magnesium transporter